MKRYSTLAALLLTSCCIPAAAGVIYSETVDGDLAGTGNPLLTLNLTVGNHTVTGTSSRFPFDFDSFAFVVPIGATLTNLNWSGTFSGSMTGANWQLRSGSAANGGGLLVQTLGSSVPATLVPLTAETYNLTATLPTGAGQTQGSVAYTFTFDVTAPTEEVPEPGTIVMLGLGAVAIYLGRRRF